MSIGPRRRVAARRPWLRLGVAALAAAAALVSGLLAARPADAALSAAGPVNPATGFPDWYQDGNGLKLQLCLDGPPFCLAAASDLAPPDGEAFWWQAEASVPAGGGTARLVLAQEAAFVDGQRISFGRARVTITGALPNATYAVTHPYGALSVPTDATGTGRGGGDIGCEPPCDFNAALGTPVGTYLTWDTSPPNSAPPAGHIGDAATPHRVVGGSNGNRFTVDGPGGGGTTDLFTVQGKLAGPPVPVFSADRSALEFGPVATGAAPELRAVTVTNLGVPAADGSSDLGFGPIGISGPDAADFTLVGNTCSGRSIPSGASCALTVAFKPGAVARRVAGLDVVHNGASRGARITLGGTGASPAVAAASAARPLAITKLRTTHRMTRARVLRRGLRLSMRVPAGTEILKIAVYRVRQGRVVRKPVWIGYRVVGRTGPYRIRLDSRALRRRLTAGLYQVNVTPGVSRRELGRTATTRVRITRR